MYNIKCYTTVILPSLYPARRSLTFSSPLELIQRQFYFMPTASCNHNVACLMAISIINIAYPPHKIIGATDEIKIKMCWQTPYLILSPRSSLYCGKTFCLYKLKSPMMLGFCGFFVGFFLA
ncbi:hypothetical protein EGW08_008711 [Elysia chlorotica]|uniref:Uncharacterized protein n=1 Tax=Elysia chlorotica TaxID=188477 RepID=A0A3S1C5I0_ELYCH|nr:hypothetical protein EGW08_008711 [Elysia chlorotica]